MSSKAKIIFTGTVLICFFTNTFIFLDIPYLRQIFGFIFLMVLPGYLILQLLNVELDYLGKFVLSWGLSISFIMLFGLLLNVILLNFGYQNPLAKTNLLFAFNLVFVTLSIIASTRFSFRDKSPKDSLYMPMNLFSEILHLFDITVFVQALKDRLKFNLTTSEKAFLVIPCLFPMLSALGIHLVNVSGNNVIIIFLLSLISIYVVFVCVFNQQISNRVYPTVIFLISISLILLLPLRSNHLIGIDIHLEYYYFQTTLNNLYWGAFSNSTLDSCLSISLLPTIFQVILDVPSEPLFKILYPIIYSVSPIIVYILSKKYIGDFHAFLASCFFMFQWIFIWTEYNARTSLAVFFIALLLMVLFNDGIDKLKKKVLIILFMISCITSHYATTYIFFFLLSSTFIIMKIFSMKYPIKNQISSTFIILFFAIIFFWYSLMTDKAFYSGVNFVESTYMNLENFLIGSSRDTTTMSVLGTGIGVKGLPHKIEFVFTWLIFIFVGSGVFTLIMNYKAMSFPDISVKPPEFLKTKFEVTYAVIAVMCIGILVIMVALPFVSKGYGMQRLYGLVSIILSVFFVIGAISLSRYFKTKPYVLILIVLLPYFLSVTGVTYNMFGIQRSIILNSDGEQYDKYYVHDQESYSAKWLEEYGESKSKIYADHYGHLRMVSQGNFSFDSINPLTTTKKIDEGYIYLRYDNVVKEEIQFEYSHQFVGKSEIYDIGRAKIYRS